MASERRGARERLQPAGGSGATRDRQGRDARARLPRAGWAAVLAAASVMSGQAARAGSAAGPASTSVAVARVAGVARDGAAIRPAVLDNLADAVRRQLFLAFSVAQRRLHDSATCRELFTGLGADGLATLARARYGAGAFDVVHGRCPGGAAAVTAVRSAEVRLCPGFAVLKTTDAAVILLHEALHSAGLGEKPPDPAALTAPEINRLVRTSCGL